MNLDKSVTYFDRLTLLNNHAQYRFFVSLFSLEAVASESEVRASSHRFRLRACSQGEIGETKISRSLIFRTIYYA